MAEKICTRCGVSKDLGDFQMILSGPRAGKPVGGRCNRAVGLMSDDADRLMAAAIYLSMRGADAQPVAGLDLPNRGVILQDG